MKVEIESHILEEIQKELEATKLFLFQYQLIAPIYQPKILRHNSDNKYSMVELKPPYTRY